ncbi:Beta-site APP-cleaving enzyme [Stylosanthes scabra]|uniref:Beta-site APP-cleaving enzyme n=1 Tax=Stylosanthes scabra TaxID=79078 RepID=A0ABU6ZSE0_9FABA|nr:Beta-site APP-cleaving enzyme [Stylosanthes scabra]
MARVPMASTTTYRIVVLLSLVFLLCSILLNFFTPLLQSHNSYIPSNNNNDGSSIISKDSPKSPLYNASTPQQTRIAQLLHRSISRMKYLATPRERASTQTQTQTQTQEPPPDISTKVTYDPKSYLYIASYYIGTPPQKILAFVDTASDLIWTNSQTAFKSSDSKTYSSLPCKDKTFCQKLPSNQRACKGSDPKCTYKIEYSDGSSTTGVISQDQFWFDAPAGQSSPKEVGFLGFGYAISASSEHFTGEDINGCLGLSRVSPFSFISQSRIQKFSHCFVKDASRSSIMYFGSQAIIHLEDSTPLEGTGYYYVKLEGILVGDNKVKVTPRQLGTIYVDSGASYSMLKEIAFTPFLELIKKVVAKPIAPSPHKYLEFCFKATKAEVEGLPMVKFQFTNNVNVVFANDVTYMEFDDGVWCLAILRSSEKDLSVLGNFQMTNLNVGYDIERNMMSFTSANCAASTY